MTGPFTLHPTRCAICHTEGNAVELYRANFDIGSFDPGVFSARRLPDGVHYRIVRCLSCGLVRSDPIASTETLARLYARSTITYDDEVSDLRITYGRYLKLISRHSLHKGALLEVGCGNGFFLLEALEQGYRGVRGVEPSSSAIAQAAPHIRPCIVCDMMRPGLFEPGQFDTVCMFQVFDHVPEPATVLDACYSVLRSGGCLLCLNHDMGAATARLMKARSPIIDIEHTYLYSQQTLSKIVRDHGFRVCEMGSAYNRYALRYLVRLLPIAKDLKQGTLTLLEKAGLGRIRLSVQLGNQYLIAQKP